MGLKRFFFLAPALFIAAGCLAPHRTAPSKARASSPRPRAVVKEILLNAPLKTSWTQTIRRLEKNGFAVESAVPQKGMIFTKWRVVENVRTEYGIRPRKKPAPLAERVRADLSLKAKPGGKTQVKVSASVQHLYRRSRRRGDNKPPAVWTTIPSNGTLEAALIAALK